ncbi:hypothetical protein HANVADRAFT_20370, partial [Hanseniaspora valbyensis NRRL Y-1626]
MKQEAKPIVPPVVKKLLNIIVAKKSNLCASLDVTTTAELLNLVEKLGPHICL